jgi:hypothetical protein
MRHAKNVTTIDVMLVLAAEVKRATGYAAIVTPHTLATKLSLYVHYFVLAKFPFFLIVNSAMHETDLRDGFLSGAIHVAIQNVVLVVLYLKYGLTVPSERMKTSIGMVRQVI